MDASFLTKWLSGSNKLVFTIYTTLAAFLLYTCVYGFRKTFAVATFDGIEYFGVSYKVWLVVFQVMGYALSKFIGIKVVSELKSGARFMGILFLSLMSGLSLLLFAITPAPYNVIFLFTNGLPLGMIWGLIFSYLEGRQTTEALGAGLSVSFIFSAGFSKTVGAFILTWGVSETWMPFVASLLFTPPLLLFLWLLNQVPPPGEIDHALRTKRKPMNGIERARFVAMFAPVLVVLILGYMLLTAMRDFRDNFSAEIWNALGYNTSPEIFTITEIPIAIIVLAAIGSLIFIKNNKKALFVNLWMILAGFASTGLGTFLYINHVINAPMWIVMTGFGLYLGYVPYNCVLFERLIAAFRISGTVGFVMYLADAFGYLGSVAVLFYKEFAQPNVSWVDFFVTTTITISICGIILSGISILYFDRKFRNETIAAKPNLIQS
ncbi:MAG TPA: DUF5690 family protein [Cyclobacteriaceae bacterium]|nr:DUF5690 family protein [Cyclobacteriaceae bacterium]